MFMFSFMFRFRLMWGPKLNPHRLDLPLAHELAPAALAALHEAVAVQLRQLRARHARAQVQAVHVLAHDVAQLARPQQRQQRLLHGMGAFAVQPYTSGVPPERRCRQSSLWLTM